MDLGLRDAVAVVSGGSKGMGRAAAECLAADGARVAVLARSAGPLSEAVDALKKAGSPDAVGLSADLLDRAQVDRAFEEIGERFGAVNALVNAAGPAGIGRFPDLSDETWLSTFDMGAMTMVRCVRAALPLLRKAEWARIVNVSAHSTRRQKPILAAYTASKAAVTSIGKNLARTLAPEGILVNTVSPGTFLSEGLKTYVDKVAPQRGLDPTNLYDAMKVVAQDYDSPCDLGRAGLPSEIGAVMAFLASRRNSYMTGADVNVDGGSDFA